jgi:hypothetical protein
MQVTRSTDTGRNLAIELILEDIPGGGSIIRDDLPTAQTELKAGTLVGESSDGKWHVSKTAMVRTAVPASGTPALTIWVYPQHTFKAGDLIGTASGIGASGVRITSITASGTEYDAIVVGSAMNCVLPASGILIESSTSGFPNTVTFRYPPTSITTNTIDTTASGNNGAGLLVRGRVRQGEMPYPIEATIKAMLPLIRFV